MSSTLADTVAVPGETWFKSFVRKLLKDYADMRFGSANVATDAVALLTYPSKKLKVVKLGVGDKAVTGPRLIRQRMKWNGRRS